MSLIYEQGDILKVDHIKYPMLVVSKNTFNKTGYAVCCPIVKDLIPGPLHIPIDASHTAGVTICEQLKYLDLRSRRFFRSDSVSMKNIMDITDAIQGLFDYY